MADVYSIFLKKNPKYTEIQEIAIPIIKRALHCLIVAPTGYGKPEASMLPLIDMASKIDADGIKVIYITPLRALNRDTIKRLEWLCGAVDVSIGVRHGDTTQKERKSQVLKAPSVLITTPETLQSILVNEKLRMQLSGLKAVVVDEIHELHHSKRGAQLSVALERLVEIAGEYQRVGISATVGDRKALALFLCSKRECKIAQAGVKRLELIVETPGKPSAAMKPISEKFGLDEQSMARLELVSKRIKESKGTIIFANTRQVVEAVGSRLVYLNSVEDFGGIGVHHSSLDRNERIELEDLFKAGGVKSIIATSSLELGIDIGTVDAVIQYGSPRQSLRLAQRVGRSGHKVSGVPNGMIIPLNTIDAIEAAVVCRRATEADFESFPIQKNALDVLANQIRGMAVETGGIESRRLLEIVKRSYVYHDLEASKLEGLLEFMAKQHMIGYGGQKITPGGGTKIYYYKHLSVITDVKKFVVKNIIGNKIISTLDERFVANNIEEGSVFITKGLPWKVVSVDEEVISVEPSMEVEAAIPDWEGEDIPVSFRTAQLVAESLSGKTEQLKRFCSEKTWDGLAVFLKSQQEYHTPAVGEIVVESFGTYKIVYTWLGTAANDALSKIIAKEAGLAIGGGVAVKTTPYAIVIEAGSGRLDIKKIIARASRFNLASYLSTVLDDSEIFRYKFISVAKLFGIIERDALVSKSMTRRIMKVMEGSPIKEEAKRELMENYFDIKSLSDFLQRVASGAILIKEVELDAASPLTKALVGYSHSAKELVLPLTPNNELVESFSKFILSKNMKFICTYCGFVFTKNLSEIRKDEQIMCGSCKSPMVSTYDDTFRDAISKRLSGKRLTRGEHNTLGEALRIAGLISSYGQRAAIALSVYGVGPTSAARALMMRKSAQRDFFVDLIEAQKNFIRTKKYWSV